MTGALAREKFRKLIDRGAVTVINGEPTVGLWEEAQPDRVTQYLSEEEWNAPVYNVFLQPEASQPPYSLSNGGEVYRQLTDEMGVVKRMFPEIIDNVLLYWDCLVVLVQRE